MTLTNTLYRHSLALMTDLYELTMAYGYWKLGRTDEQAVFNLFFRQHPFRSGYTVAAGLGYLLDYLDSLRFDARDVAYLATLTGNDGGRLFEPAFLEYLEALRFDLDVEAIPEGTVVFPHQPLVRVSGPILQCQLVEAPLLNVVNFQTLIATKASRICQAACGQDVLEFGLRRAQGFDGALAASRAAYIGGCAATSNVLAGKLFGIPVRGTHAHSWVMSFEGELESFDAYARAMPNNCVFLVDTYDTLEGVAHAVEIGRRLRAGGHEMVGIRLDSGDLAYLSIEARRLLDAGGFPKAVIVASNDLDEQIIHDLKAQGAKIGVWGVGTRLVTGHDEPALGGVYKLSAVRKPGQPWSPRLKLSEQAVKVSNPGRLQVRRYRRDGEFLADMMYEEDLGVPARPVIVDPLDPTRRKALPAGAKYEDLLVPVLRGGRCVYNTPALADIRSRTAAQLAGLHAGVRRFVNPHQYPTGLEEGLHALKTRLILQARGFARDQAGAKGGPA